MHIPSTICKLQPESEAEKLQESKIQECYLLSRQVANSSLCSLMALHFQAIF